MTRITESDSQVRQAVRGVFLQKAPKYCPVLYELVTHLKDSSDINVIRTNKGEVVVTCQHKNRDLRCLACPIKSKKLYLPQE